MFVWRRRRVRLKYFTTFSISTTTSCESSGAFREKSSYWFDLTVQGWTTSPRILSLNRGIQKMWKLVREQVSAKKSQLRTKKKSQFYIADPKLTLCSAALHSGALSPRLLSCTVRMYRVMHHSAYITHIIEGCDHVTSALTEVKSEVLKTATVRRKMGSWTFP